MLARTQTGCKAMQSSAAPRYTAVVVEHLEGRESVLAALHAFERRFQLILIRHGSHIGRYQEILGLAALRNVPVHFVDARQLDAMAHGATHGGVLAVVGPKPRLAPAALIERIEQSPRPAFLLLLEGVDDARNLGFTLRSADALGADAVLIKKHLWNFDPVEVARPASGAYERLPLVQLEDVDLLRKLQRRVGVSVIGCLASAQRTIYQTDLTGPVLLAVGGEKRGLSAAVRQICDSLVRIPARGLPSSLSLSHAASIAMAEVMRQRLQAGPSR